MGDLESFAAHKALLGTADEWTPLDCLRELVRRIEAGEMEAPTGVVVNLLLQDDGALDTGLFCAGVTRHTACYVLQASMLDLHGMGE